MKNLSEVTPANFNNEGDNRLAFGNLSSIPPVIFSLILNHLVILTHGQNII